MHEPLSLIVYNRCCTLTEVCILLFQPCTHQIHYNLHRNQGCPNYAKCTNLLKLLKNILLQNLLLLKITLLQNLLLLLKENSD